MEKQNDMKLLGVYAISFIILSVIVILGSVLLNGFGQSLRTSTTTAQVKNLFTVPAILASTNIGTAATYPYLQDVTGCVNSSNAAEKFNTTYYRVTTGNYWTPGYVTLLNVTDGTTAGNWTGLNVNCSVTYLADTTGSDAAETFNTGLLTFGTFLALIILALIGKIIIRMFRHGL